MTKPTVARDALMELAGQPIDCSNCSGHGLVLSMGGEPDECRDCGGSGKNWQYPKGAIARYYSGPLTGRALATRSGDQ